jgi:YHS domain-containing protein
MLTNFPGKDTTMKTVTRTLRAVLLSVMVVALTGGCCMLPHFDFDKKDADDHAAHQAADAAEDAIEQTTCPVMGGDINKDSFTEYKGKKVYFCCPLCKNEFEKDPEKYISKLPQFQN